MGKTVGLTHVFRKSFLLLSPTEICGVITTFKETLCDRTIFNSSVCYGDILQGQKRQQFKVGGQHIKENWAIQINTSKSF